MRVLHLSTFDIRGGAARGTYSLHRSLSDRGVDSRMLVSRKFSDDPTVVEPPHLLLRLSNAVRSRLDAMPLRNYRKTGDSYWTIGWLPTRIDRLVDAYQPDIVHIHWTGGGFMSINSLRQLPYPIVWTLRDMWALTGGCHYSAGCERFAEACGRCPQLRSDDANDLSHRMLTRKRDAWKGTDLWIVPISSWLADCARRSAVFDHMPINVIPNGIDTTCFHPSAARATKAAWGLPQDKLHVLFGAIDATTDPRKGFQHLRNAIQKMARDGWSDRIELLVFGGEAPSEDSTLGLPIRSVGNVNDDDMLAKLYSACDVMVAPSTQEAFGKTLVEAMACGTPVVAFASGGPVDIVEHRRTGYLAEPFSAESLAAGIAWCIENDERKLILGDNARARVERKYELGVVAESYKSLYRQILSRAP